MHGQFGNQTSGKQSFDHSPDAAPTEQWPLEGSREQLEGVKTELSTPWRYLLPIENFAHLPRS